MSAFNLKGCPFFLVILLLHVTLYVAVLSNISVFRSVFGFLFLLFVPGFVVFRLFRLKIVNLCERVFFSVCLGIAFLMLFGVFLDLLGPLAGFSQPLSTGLIVVCLSLVLLPLSFFGADDVGFNFNFNLGLTRSRLFFLVFGFVLLGVLSVYGLFVVNVYGDNFVVLLLLFLMAVVVCVACVSERLVPSRFYPWILLTFCAVLVFVVSNVTALVSNYIMGSDQWVEFLAFRTTDILSRWIPTVAPSVNSGTLFPTYSMLSVTVLPTIFERVTLIDGSWLFKLLYPAVACFVVLGLYALFRSQTDRKVAFLAVFFFVAVSIGKGFGTDKQLVAEVFLAALLLLVFMKGLPRLKRDILFFACSLGLVVSHYGLAYIFMLILVSAWTILVFMDYVRSGSFSVLHSKVSFDWVLIYLTVLFSWYIFVNQSVAFNLLSQKYGLVASGFSQFFNPASRGTALEGLGVVATPTILNQVSTYMFVLTESLIILGFVWILLRRNTKGFGRGFSSEYVVMAALGIAILILDVLVPTLANTLQISRYYQTTLFLLAPFAVVGGLKVLERIPRLKSKYFFVILMFLIFVPFFLFQTGFVYEVAGVQNDVLTLNMHRWNDLKFYDVVADSREVAGAAWLPEHLNVSQITIYADAESNGVLTAYGLVEGGQIPLLTNVTYFSGSNQFIFLRPVNVIDGITEGVSDFNSSSLLPVLVNQDRIYSNGGCEVYAGVP